jgi:hypothetical protein
LTLSQQLGLPLAGRSRDKARECMLAGDLSDACLKKLDLPLAGRCFGDACLQHVVVLCVQCSMGRSR